MKALEFLACETGLMHNKIKDKRILEEMIQSAGLYNFTAIPKNKIEAEQNALFLKEALRYYRSKKAIWK